MQSGVLKPESSHRNNVITTKLKKRQGSLILGITYWFPKIKSRVLENSNWIQTMLGYKTLIVQNYYSSSLESVGEWSATLIGSPLSSLVT